VRYQIFYITSHYELNTCVPVYQTYRFSPDSPKPDSPNLEKVYSMSKCSCFVAKKSYSVILSLRNIPSMQHYVLIISRHSRKAFKNARTLSECRKISNLLQHTRNVVTAQNYNSRKFRLKCNWRYGVRFFQQIGFRRIGKTPTYQWLFTNLLWLSQHLSQWYDMT